MSVKLIRNARIHTPVDGGRPAAGETQGALRSYQPGALIARDGYVAAIGPESEILERLGHSPVDAEIDSQDTSKPTQSPPRAAVERSSSPALHGLSEWEWRHQ